MTASGFRSPRTRGDGSNAVAMSRRGLIGMAAPALIGVSPLTRPGLAFAQQSSEATYKRAAIAKAIAWMNDRNDGLVAKVINGAIADFKQAMEDEIDISKTFGSNLTKSKQPYQIWIRTDEFFAFPLTRAQGSILGLGNDDIITFKSGPRREAFAFPLAAELRDLKIADSMKNNAGVIAGRVSSRRLDDMDRKFLIRLKFSLGRLSTEITKTLGRDDAPPQAAPDGLLDFDVSATFEDRNEKKGPTKYVGPLAIFVSLVTMEGSNDVRVVRSNTLGTMVNILPS
jgi:hypothetical protein